MEPVVEQYLANKAAHMKAEGQIKLFKGALEQEGQVVLTLINAAVSEQAPPREAFGTGTSLNLTA